MPVSVKNIVLWRKETENRPGVLAETLAPFAQAGADLQVVMGYRHPGDPGKAAIELYPVAGTKQARAASQAGLSASAIPTVHVEGDNRAALGHAIAQALADASVNLTFLVAQVIGRKYSAVIGFENEADAKKASALIKKASSGKKK